MPASLTSVNLSTAAGFVRAAQTKGGRSYSYVSLAAAIRVLGRESSGGSLVSGDEAQVRKATAIPGGALRSALRPQLHVLVNHGFLATTRLVLAAEDGGDREGTGGSRTEVDMDTYLEALAEAQQNQAGALQSLQAALGVKEGENLAAAVSAAIAEADKAALAGKDSNKEGAKSPLPPSAGNRNGLLEPAEVREEDAAVADEKDEDDEEPPPLELVVADADLPAAPELTDARMSSSSASSGTLQLTQAAAAAAAAWGAGEAAGGAALAGGVAGREGGVCGVTRGLGFRRLQQLPQSRYSLPRGMLVGALKQRILSELGLPAGLRYVLKINNCKASPALSDQQSLEEVLAMGCAVASCAKKHTEQVQQRLLLYLSIYIYIYI